MDHDDFDNVSWQNNPEAHDPVSSVVSPRGVSEDEGSGDTNGKRNMGGGQLGPKADPLDLAGVGEGVLECTVTSPIKENDGTKDAYVSYLVTTNVC
jgi:sorting nexin-4